MLKDIFKVRPYKTQKDFIYKCLQLQIPVNPEAQCSAAHS